MPRYVTNAFPTQAEPWSIQDGNTSSEVVEEVLEIEYLKLHNTAGCWVITYTFLSHNDHLYILHVKWLIKP